MDNSVKIVLEHVSKSYNLGKEQKQVLSDINLEINEGERVGLIGRNGAGKSTLLNIISGFAKENSGRICINGKVSAILEVGTNLSLELSGRDNIYQSGELYGISKKEIDSRIVEIEEFVDLGNYFDKPLKIYSSGMRARIAFAQIAFIQPEILIIDEVLGVGDIKFVEKSTKKINELCDKGKILIIVSHSLETITDMTNRCVWIDQGKIVMDAKSEKVVREYKQFVNKLEQDALSKKEQLLSANVTKPNQILNILLSDEKNNTNNFMTGCTLLLKAEIKCEDSSGKWNLRIIIEDYKGCIFLINDYFNDSGQYLPIESNKTLSLSTEIQDCRFTQSSYILIIELINNEIIVDKKEKIFQMEDPLKEYYTFPLAYTDSYWEITYNNENIKNEHIWTNSKQIKN